MTFIVGKKGRHARGRWQLQPRRKAKDVSPKFRRCPAEVGGGGPAPWPPIIRAMSDIWPASGFRELQRDDHGWLVPTDAYLRLFLACRSSRWSRSRATPSGACTPRCSPRRRGRSRRSSCSPSPTPMRATTTAHFLRFRDALLAAGTLEAWYLAVFRAARSTCRRSSSTGSPKRSSATSSTASMTRCCCAPPSCSFGRSGSPCWTAACSPPTARPPTA
jgi:hypothetical protein